MRAKERLEDLSIEELQERIKQQLAKPWARFERTVKSEIVPLLYHLRKKLHAPGSRTGAGWAAWVEENLSISVRTCDHWTSEYAKQHRLPGFDGDKLTSSQLARGRTTADSQVQISVNWIGTPEEQQRVIEACEVLGDSVGRVTSDALTRAADKKGVRHAKPAARRVAATA